MSLILLPPDIAPNEVVTHYILSKSEYSVTKSQVKPRALEPSSEDGSISVFRIQDLDDNEIWQLGRQKVNIPGNQALRARADITVSSIRAANLRVRAEEPPPRHALVFGWPENKDAIMAKAQVLAAQATLRLPDA